MSLAQPRGELAALFSVSYPKVRLSDMVLESSILMRMMRLIEEHRLVGKLRAHGLGPRRRLLLLGPPGTGKTMAAGVLAGELGMPLFVVRLDSLITKFMGETAAKLRMVFDALASTRGVYFFDEFDSIGSRRAAGNDVGEIRRVLNSFLQFLEMDNSDSLIVAATNHPELLDAALYRRFDDVLEFRLPDTELILEALKARLAGFQLKDPDWPRLIAAAEGLSYAEITRACEESAKDMIIQDREFLTGDEIERALAERKAFLRRTPTGE